MPYRFRHAMCNEAFEKQPFAEVCRSLRNTGYQGIEIAPFTLADDPATIPAGQRRAYKSMIESEGLQFVGLHWLLVGPKGLHATTPDAALRNRTWQHLHNLVDLCADLGDNGVMVFGSPNQRATIGGLTREQATRHFVDGLAEIAPHARQRGVTILVEALPKAQCDVVLTLEEAVSVVRGIGNPAIQTMFDTHNAVDETEPHAKLVGRHYKAIRHIHVNEMDGRYPGTGSYDFKPLLDVLRRREYPGWVSLEVFDFTPGAEKIASQSLRFLESEISKLPHE